MTPNAREALMHLDTLAAIGDEPPLLTLDDVREAIKKVDRLIAADKTPDPRGSELVFMLWSWRAGELDIPF